MIKNKPKIKIKGLIDSLAPPEERQTKQRAPFQKPKTQEEMKNFHKMNEEGIRKAYASKEGYFKDGNKLYVAGTRDFQDVMDWPRIPLGTFQKSKIYKNIDPVFDEDKTIDYVVGHSAGGSAALELLKNYPDRNITPVTYNAPVFELADGNKWVDEDKKPLRFAILGDPVSIFDGNAQTTVKAPDFNLEGIANVSTAYANPSIEKVIKAGRTATFDPLLGLHSMSNSYSSPSKPKDFLKSGVKGLAIASGIGVV